MRKNVFTPVIGAALLVLISGTMAIRMGFAGASFFPSLNTNNPALARVAPQLNPGQRKLARRVVLVIIDGLRLKESYQIPYLNRLRKLGVDAKATSHYPTFSRPNHVGIATGVPPRWSGVRSNDYDEAVHVDSLMHRIRASKMRSAYVADMSNGLPVMFSKKNGDRYDNPFDDIHYVRWPGGFVAASKQCVTRGYELVILLPGYVDAAGHEYGGDSPEYRKAALRSGTDLELAMGGLDLRRDAIIVTADHGHTDGGGHGGTEPEVLNVPLIMAGKGIRPGSSIVDAQLQDVAPTVSALLGIPAPGHGTGRALTEALEMTRAERTLQAEHDTRRVERNNLVNLSWAKDAAAKRANKRLWRLPIVLTLFALAFGLMFFGVRIGALKFDWRVIVIALPAFPVTYYLVLGLFGQNFSPSFIPARGSVVGVLFRFGLISTASHIIACWYALRGRVVLRERLAAANGLTMCGLVVSLFPAGLAWAWHTGPFVELPSEGLLVLIPGTFVAVGCFAMAAGISLGLEIVVFFARAVDPRVKLRRLESAAAKMRERIDSEGDGIPVLADDEADGDSDDGDVDDGDGDGNADDGNADDGNAGKATPGEPTDNPDDESDEPDRIAPAPGTDAPYPGASESSQDA